MSFLNNSQTERQAPLILSYFGLVLILTCPAVGLDRSALIAALRSNGCTESRREPAASKSAMTAIELSGLSSAATRFLRSNFTLSVPIILQAVRGRKVVLAFFIIRQGLQKLTEFRLGRTTVHEVDISGSPSSTLKEQQTRHCLLTER